MINILTQPKTFSEETYHTNSCMSNEYYGWVGVHPLEGMQFNRPSTAVGVESAVVDKD